MDLAPYRKIALDGLWRNNTATVQLLGLCPLLACSASVVNGLGLGLATLLALTASNTAIALTRRWTPDTLRLPIFVLIIAAIVTCIELMLHAWAYPLYQALGIFIPLIVTNCALLGRAEAFASRNPVLTSAFDGLMIGAGFTLALALLGGVRELLGNGTLFASMHLLFGETARDWKLTLPHAPRLLFFILPPGAFLGLGLLIAGKNLIDRRLQRNARPAPAGPEIRRARVTGPVN